MYLSWYKLVDAAIKSKAVAKEEAESWDVRRAKALLSKMGLPENLGNYAQDCGAEGDEWVLSNRPLPYDRVVRLRKAKRLWNDKGHLYLI
jgi:hypothetical protein